MPNWLNVEFDHALAAAAAGECRATAIVLDEAVGEMAAKRHLATSDWTGDHKDSFTESEAARRGGVGDTAGGLRSLASAIDNAAHDALDEQARRVAERERWQQEWAAEQVVIQPTPGGAHENGGDVGGDADDSDEELVAVDPLWGPS